MLHTRCPVTWPQELFPGLLRLPGGLTLCPGISVPGTALARKSMAPMLPRQPVLPDVAWSFSAFASSLSWASLQIREYVKLRWPATLPTVFWFYSVKYYVTIWHNAGHLGSLNFPLKLKAFYPCSLHSSLCGQGVFQSPSAQSSSFLSSQWREWRMPLTSPTPLFRPDMCTDQSSLASLPLACLLYIPFQDDCRVCAPQVHLGRHSRQQHCVLTLLGTRAPVPAHSRCWSAAQSKPHHDTVQRPSAKNKITFLLFLPDHSLKTHVP